MRRRKGVDRSPGDPLDPGDLLHVDVYVYPRQHSATFQDIPDWYHVGARCRQCRHAGLLDRWELAWRYGRQRMLITLEAKLRCTKCENRTANDFVLVKRG